MEWISRIVPVFLLFIFCQYFFRESLPMTFLPTATGIFLALLVAAIGSIVSLSLVLFFKRRGSVVVGCCACFVMMLAVLALLPFAWPYPKPDGPRPLAQETRDQ